MKHIVAAMILCSSAVADEPTTISLGGPRKAAATITTTDEDYDVKVSLVPVRCFDPGMNRRLSQEKAQLFAREALLRHLGGNKRKSAVFKNIEVIDAGKNVDNRFVFAIRVPRQGVQLTDAAETKFGIASAKDGRRSLFKAKDDHQETLEVIAKAMSDELPVVGDDIDKFYSAVADAEELGINRLNTLRKEIKQDILLLSIERDELLQMVAVEEKRFLDGLRKRVEKAEGDR